MGSGTSAQASLLIRSDDEDAIFTLHKRKFGSAEVVSRRLEDGTIVRKNNSASRDMEMVTPGGHFLLHYLTASRLPSAPQVPQLTLDLEGHWVPGTLGCSNSTYP
jgi:hypothetical protein